MNLVSELDILKKLFPSFRFSQNKIIYKGTAIPSKLYPIDNKKHIKIFHYFNTHPLENEVLKNIFDKTNIQLGHCYTNCNEFLERAIRLDVHNVVPYVGWITIGDGNRLIHHCWLVVDGKHVIDGSINLKDLELMLDCAEKNLSDQEQRELLYTNYFKTRKMLNSEKYVFGQVFPNALYIGSPCLPQDGVNLFNKLMRDFPKHPSYLNNNPDGSSKLQKMILEKLD